MKTPLIITLCAFMALGCASSSQSDSCIDYNLGFEIIEEGKPAGWWKNSVHSTNYDFAIDSMNVLSGRYSVSLERLDGDEVDFASWGMSIPKKYNGSTIKLSGYIKTENVESGYAGLWLRLDPNVGFDNMSDGGAKGTCDWKKFSVTLRYKSDMTKEIVAGCILQGDGKAWFDDLSITIDGKEIGSLEELSSGETPALRDTTIFRTEPIEAFAISEDVADRLETLGHVWGIMKYFHPEVAKGNYNMDAELFRILPDVLNTEKNLDELMTEWIRHFGEVSSKGRDPEPIPWVEDNCSDELKEAIYKVAGSSRKYPGHYIYNENAGNPKFTNDWVAYPQMKYGDIRFNLLALFKYWNMIEYYFPYKNLIADWDGVMREYIPVFGSVSEEKDYILTVMKLVAEIEDTHAQVYGYSDAYREIKGVKTLGYTVRFVGDTLVVCGAPEIPENETPILKNGDIITSLNGEPTDSIVKRMLPYTSASNYPTKLRVIASQIFKTNDASAEVGFIRDGEESVHRLPSYTGMLLSAQQPRDTCFRKIGDEIAYVYPGTYSNKYRNGLWPHIKDTKGLIIDLRYYPFDFMLYDFGELLVSERTPFCYITVLDPSNPGKFRKSFRPLSYGKKNDEAYKGKVVVLINEETQSNGEFTAQAYSYAPNVVVMGSTTAGADGNISRILLPGNLRTLISGIGIYLEDGSETQKVGIAPDYVVRPTVAGIRDNRDELLDAAVNYIRDGYHKVTNEDCAKAVLRNSDFIHLLDYDIDAAVECFMSGLPETVSLAKRNKISKTLRESIPEIKDIKEFNDSFSTWYYDGPSMYVLLTDVSDIVKEYLSEDEYNTFRQKELLRYKQLRSAFLFMENVYYEDIFNTVVRPIYMDFHKIASCLMSHIKDNDAG